MILSRMGHGRSAGVALLVQAIAAGPAIAGSFDAADFASAPPVDVAVLRRATAGADGVTASPAWSWRPAAFAACLRSVSCDLPARSYGTSVPAPDGVRVFQPGERPNGRGETGRFAALRASVGCGDSIRLLVQWRESTTARHFGGTSHAAVDLALDVTVTGLMAFSGVRY